MNDRELAKLVVHCKRNLYEVYIGRPSVWGNPFRIGPDEERESAIAKYEAWIRSRPEMMAKVKTELKGKVLGCWCRPRLCHGDVLAKIANED